MPQSRKPLRRAPDGRARLAGQGQRIAAMLQRLFREGPIPLEDQGGDREALPDFVCGVIVAVLSHVASLCIAGAVEVPSIPGL